MSGGLVTRACRRAGFTLLEILAVILIIGILSAVLITQLGGAEDAAGAVNTRSFLATLQEIIAEYERGEAGGDFPPSTFTAEQGVPNDGTNVGVEALVVALYSNKYNGGGHELEDHLMNTDGDLSGRSITDFGNRKLNEFVDYWKNPIAYIHRRDYGADDRPYLVYDRDLAQEVRDFPQAYKNPTTGQYYRHTKFQLISAGADGRFNTGDDITNFDRKK